MKKEDVLAGLFGSIVLLAVFLTFTFIGVNAAPTNATFTVNLTISGNANPTITWVQTGVSVNPLESSTRTIYVAFNVTDNNGFADVNYNTAEVDLMLNGEPHRTSGSCIAYNNDTLVMQLNCSITLQYYDRDGSWTINASASDLSTAYVEDTAQTMSYGVLQAIRANKDGITFSSVTLSQQTGAFNDPFVLNNTGNQNFTEVNITAYNLVGAITPAQYISASNLYVNISQDNFGDQLANNSMVRLTNGSVSRDIGGNDNNRNVYFWVNVPSGGLSNQNYVSSSPWIIEVFP